MTVSTAEEQRVQHAEAVDTRMQAWKRDGVLFHDIMKRGGIQSYVDGLRQVMPGMYEAAFSNTGIVVCSDERVGDTCGGNINSAGSGILLTPEEKARLFKESHATGITWHAGCAAAAGAYRKEHNLPDDTPVDSQVVDNYAEAKARQDAEDYNLDYLGRIGPEGPDWHGDGKHHFTRALYWLTDAVSFSPHALPGLPVGFTVTRSCLTEERALEIASFLSNVALGSHGYGELLTAEEPFWIIVVADSQEQLDAHTAVLQKHFASDRYQVHGFIR